MSNFAPHPLRHIQQYGHSNQRVLFYYQMLMRDLDRYFGDALKEAERYRIMSLSNSLWIPYTTAEAIHESRIQLENEIDRILYFTMASSDYDQAMKEIDNKIRFALLHIYPGMLNPRVLKYMEEARIEYDKLGENFRKSNKPNMSTQEKEDLYKNLCSEVFNKYTSEEFHVAFSLVETDEHNILREVYELGGYLNLYPCLI